MREGAYPLSFLFLTATAAAFLFASTAHADPPCCTPQPVSPCHGYGCGIADNAAYHFNPTGNNPNIPRGLVGSGYYGAYSPDGYSHSACVADFGAGYHDGIADYNRPAFAPTSGYYQTGQTVQTQTTNYRPSSPARRGYGWW